LIRRAQVPDELPGGYKLNAGQDIMISVYNIHRSSEVLLGVFKCEKLSFVGQMQLLTLSLNLICILCYKIWSWNFKSQSCSVLGS